MAINPLLLNVKPISEITTVNNPTNGHLLFYDGSDELKKVDIIEFQSLIGGIAKPLAIADATPTTEGWYKPTTSGTYANAGGLVAQVGYDTLFYFDGTTWSKVEVDLPQQIVNNYITENTYNLDPNQIVPSEALYNDDTLAGDIIKRVDINTGEDVNYRETTTWHDGSVMTDAKVDGVIYKKVGTKYFELQYDSILNVRWFGAKGDGITDDTESFTKALNAGKSIFIPAGRYLVGKLKIPMKFKGQKIFGVGYNHWNSNDGTVLQAIDTEIFSFENGADWIKISDLRLEGDYNSDYGFNAEFGANIILDNLGVYNFNEIGIKSRQGLWRISNCFIARNKIGLELYSDSSVSNSEFTGGEIPLKVVAGGNRFVNCWINSGTVNCIHITPLNENTNNHNNSFVGCYIGEVYTTGESPIIVISGNNSRRCTTQLFSNCFIVNGASDIQGSNGFFDINKSDDVIINGCSFQGQGGYSSGSRKTSYCLKIANSVAITLSNCNIYSINSTSIVTNNTSRLNITGNVFSNCGDNSQLATEIPIMNLSDDTFITAITNNIFFNSDSNVYALNAVSMLHIMFENNYLYYPSPKTIITSGNWSGSYFRAGYGKFEVGKVLKSKILTEAPLNPQDGDFYFDTTQNKILTFYNGNWQ